MMIPRAFRIQDFRSIVDTGECSLSADGITVLAGQNEAGKSSILMALRDFDLPVGGQPETTDFMPDTNFDAIPRVSILFDINIEELQTYLDENQISIPNEVLQAIQTRGKIWITRNLIEGNYKLDDEIANLWPVSKKIGSPQDAKATQQKIASSEIQITETVPLSVDNGSSSSSPAENDNLPETVQEDNQSDTNDNLPSLLSHNEFLEEMRGLWPVFVYFSSFEDMLPREVILNVTPTLNNSVKKTEKVSRLGLLVPKTVFDFIDLSGIDLEKVAELSSQDKALSNYLAEHSANITGDFLTYWTQTSNGKDTVELIVKHMRSETGVFKLQFYVRDKSDQYPEQRSRGFLWFLSFYLRLAAWDRNEDNNNRLVLIDEPGSYLHAKAQRDILKVLEERVKNEFQTFIYTTHSPYLLPLSTMHRYRVVVKDDDSGTKVLEKLTHPLLSDQRFSDALTPFLTSVGFDIKDVIPLVGENNLLVEGISDYIYIHTWIKVIEPELHGKLNVFPGTGAASLKTLVSLFIGWGLHFAVLLDHDDQGNDVINTLKKDFHLSDRQLIQPSSAVSIEDMFSISDFKLISSKLDKDYSLIKDDSPSKAIKRHKIDKVLLARTYGEMVTKGEITLSGTSEKNIKRLLTKIKEGITLQPHHVS